MAISERLVISARLDLSGVASDVDKLRSQLESASKVSTASLDIESKKAALLDARIAKEQASIEKINALKEQAAAKEQARLDSQIAKEEAATQRDIARKEQAASKEQQIAASTIAALERQKAASVVRVADGGDKEAARVAQEILRAKQQIAAIDAKLINPTDITNAKALANEINRLNLEKIKKEFDDASPVTFNQFIGATTEKARDLAEQLQQTSRVLGQIGGAFNRVNSAATEAFLAFDTAKTKVATLSNQSNIFANTAVKLSGELRNQVTSTEIITAQYEILSSGFSNVADASEIARVSVLGAKAGFTDTATVADATTSILNAYGLAASDAANVVDQLAVVQDKGKTTIGQFAGQLGKVAPIAASAGVSLNELNAAVASVTIKGVKTETAVSGIRQAIVNLVTPTQAAQKALEDIGITNAATTLKTEGLTGVLNRLKAAGITSSSQLSKIFTDIDGLTAVVPLLNDDLKNFNANLEAVGNASGKAQNGFDIVANSAGGKITKALNKANEALVNIGRGATVAFAPFIGVAGDVIGIFNQLPAPVQTAAGAIIGISGALFTGAAALTAAGAAAPAFVGGLKLLGFEAGRATIASVALTTATNINAGANAFLSKQITLTAIAQSAATAKTIVATAATNTWTAAVALGSTQVTWLGVKTAASALIAKASFASFATGIAGLLTPLGLVATAVGALVIGVKPFFDAFDNSEVNKSLEETRIKLKRIREERGKIDPTEKENDQFGNKGFFQNPFDGSGTRQRDTIRIGEELTSGKSESTRILNENIKTLQDFGQANADVAKRTKLSVEKQLEFNKAIEGEKKEIDALIEGRNALIATVGGGTPAAKLIQGDISLLQTRKKLLDQRLADVKASTEKEAAIIEEATKEQLKKAARILEERNQDKELGIKRSQEDDKTKRDRKNADAIKAIEEKNAIAKGELDRKQALETEALKERQTQALQDKQRAFDDTQDAKKIALEDTLDAKRRANEDKLNKLKQAFDDSQNALKEQRAKKQRKDDEAFAEQRAARDKQASEALSGAKQLISNEGAIATAKPEDRAKIAAQIAEEERIRAQAATQGVSGAETQEQLVARAKQLARVSAIATAEEQAKVQLALDELEKANKAKQAEIDKAEDAKRAEAKQASDKAFEAELNASKLAFDAEQNNAKLNFENTVLKPEKEKIEAELNASKLAFERGELAALKAQQAADEEALKLQQTNQDLALQKAATAELDAIKLAQKEKELALDRAFEDQKIERERAFKEEQRNLDKASAAEIQAILGQTSKQLFAAVAAISNSKISAIAGIGAKNNIVPTTRDKGDPLAQIKTGADAAIAAAATPSAAELAVKKVLKNKISAFANGGVSNGGLALVGERGAELVNLPKGASVTPANDTRSLLSRGGDNKRVEVLLERLIGSLARPNLEIKTTDDPATIAADIYRKSAAQDLRRSGL
jgi:TP901 family phage tail tape measure protein